MKPGAALPSLPPAPLPRRQHGFAATRVDKVGRELLDPFTFAYSAPAAREKAIVEDTRARKRLRGVEPPTRFARVLRVVLEPVYEATPDESLGD